MTRGDYNRIYKAVLTTADFDGADIDEEVGRGFIDKISRVRLGEEVSLTHDEQWLLDRMKMFYFSVFGEDLIQSDETYRELYY